MLAKRIIPTLLYRGHTLVKGQRFDSWRSVGHVLQAARIHAARGVDELVMLDIGATPSNAEPNYRLIEQLTENTFTPISVGGGIRTIEHVRALLNAGADKIVLGTNAVPLVNQVAKACGCQAVVAAIDIKGRCVHWAGGTYAADMDAVTYAIAVAEWGAGEIILTSIEREGTLEGYDLELIRAVSAAVDIPVVAHGGAGTYEHMHEALRAGADAVAAGAMFQFTDQTPRGAAEYLAGKGWEVRL